MRNLSKESNELSLGNIYNNLYIHTLNGFELGQSDCTFLDLFQLSRNTLPLNFVRDIELPFESGFKQGI
jgi:hypothetical protein